MMILRHILAVLGICFVAQQVYRLLVGGYGWSPDNGVGTALCFTLGSVVLYAITIEF